MYKFCKSFCKSRIKNMHTGYVYGYRNIPVAHITPFFNNLTCFFPDIFVKGNNKSILFKNRNKLTRGNNLVCIRLFPSYQSFSTNNLTGIDIAFWLKENKELIIFKSLLLFRFNKLLNIMFFIKFSVIKNISFKQIAFYSLECYTCIITHYTHITALLKFICDSEMRHKMNSFVTVFNVFIRLDYSCEHIILLIISHHNNKYIISKISVYSIFIKNRI